MAREKVQVIGFSAADPAAVWAVARDFCGMWHPSIATMQPERDPQGHLIRAFAVKGEDKIYRERLTYFSDTDMTLAYSHVEGIADVDRYDARMSITKAQQGGSVIQMTANLTAPVARAKAIAAGTEAIFKDAVAALATRAESGVAATRAESGVAATRAESGVAATRAESGVAATRAESGVAATRAESGVAATRAVPLAAQVATETQLIDTLPRLAIDVTRPKGGPLCLFLHGIGGSRLNWRQQLGVIGNKVRAAALDLRGYGDSTLGPHQSTVDDYCDDILRVAQVLGANRLILVGLSYGSWVATSFAMRHPDMLAGLVLSGGCTGMSEAGAAERDAFRVSREVPLNAGQIPADFAPAVVNVIAGPDASAAIRAELHASMAAIPAATYRDALVCFTNPLERFDFARLTMPVLMMTGEYDRLAPPSEIRQVAERIFDASPAPDVRFEVIPGVGHVCNVEGADVYSRHLADFVARIVP